MKPLHFASVLTILVLGGCGPSSIQQATQTASVLTLTAGAWTSTPEPTATATFTPTPTTTSTPTATATKIPTKTLTPSPTPDPARYYSPDNSLSFVRIDNWQPLENGTRFPSLVGPIVAGFQLNMFIYEDELAFPVSFYAATVQDSLIQRLQDYSQISEDFLTTDEGKDYFRWEIKDTNQGVVYRQVLYFFESGDWKLIITFTRPEAQGSEYDTLVDQAMQTVRYQH